jgi:archaellum component FlaF (FlaF/FlaG flagellin family)
MGFSVSATMAIFFAAFLILFSILYSSLNDAFDSVTDSFDDKYDSMDEKLQTQVQILEVYYVKETDSLKVTVQNTGSIVLDMSKVDIIINGSLVASPSMNVSGKTTDVWLPLETLTVTVPNPDIDFSSSIDPRTHVLNDAGLSAPGNISVASSAYIIDGVGIDVFSLEGVFDFGISDSTNMISPTDVKAYGDYLYVLDQGSHIDRFDLDGMWVDQVVNDSSNTPNPVSFAVDSEYIYIVDNNTHVDRFNRTTGSFVDQLIANGGTMSAPVDVTVGSYVYILDYSGGYHIDRYALDGSGGTQIISSAYLSSPTDLSATPAEQENPGLYVVNDSREILVFNETGSLSGTIDSCLSDSVSAVDVNGRVFVSDGINGLVIENLGTNVKVVVENGISCVAQL